MGAVKRDLDIYGFDAQVASLHVHHNT